MRLIDADELLKGKEDHQMISTHMIWNAPTVDAVPVVRCKECNYWNPHIKECEGIVNWFGLANEWSENGFCFKAERKKE